MCTSLHSAWNLLHIRVFRLLDVVHSDQKLYLVFEYLNQDLKRYMDMVGDAGLDLELVKVRICNFYARIQ